MRKVETHKLTERDVDELCSALKRTLLETTDWENKLEKVREEARGWRVRALEAERKLEELKNLLK